MEYVGIVEYINIFMVIFIRTLKAHVLKHLSVDYIKIGSIQKKRELLSKILKYRMLWLWL